MRTGGFRGRDGRLQVVLFGLNYWPEETGIAPYTTGLAEHLAANDAGVTVVAGMPHYPQWQVFDGYEGRGSRRETVRGVDIVRLRQYIPSRQTAVRRALFEGTFLASGLRSLRLPRPDVVIGVVPSLAAGLLAALVARRHGVPYGLIFQDLVGLAARESGIAGGTRVAGATAAVEGRLARGANRVAIVAEAFRSHLESAAVVPDRIVALPNWSHVAPPALSRDVVRDQLGWPPDARVILHAGNMGLKQGLEQVIEAARVAAERQPELRFVLMGDGSQRANLERLATGSPNLTFLDSQPSSWFSEVLHAADVLLVSQRSTVTDMALPSKLTSYFVAGRPVVAAVAGSSATAAMVEQSGSGIVVPPDDPVQLVAAISRVTSDEGLSQRLALAGPTFAEQHLSAAVALSRADAFVREIAGCPSSRAAVPTGPRRGAA